MTDTTEKTRQQLCAAAEQTAYAFNELTKTMQFLSFEASMLFTKTGEDLITVTLGINRLRLKYRYQRDHGTRKIRMRKGRHANRR
jgi:hypothetical protein